MQTKASPLYVDDRFASVVHAEGEIDVATAVAFGQKLRAAIAKGTNSMVVDMTDVTFMDSSGLNQLVLAFRRMTPNGSLTLRHASPIVRRMLQIRGLDTVFTVED